MKKLSILIVILISTALIALIWGCKGTDSNPNEPVNGCGSADDVCKMEPVNWQEAVGEPPSGPYEVSIELNSGLSTHTIYRPMDGDGKMPIVSWANGRCFKMGLFFDEFLVEIASHGFLVISDGIPDGGGSSEGSMANPTGTA